MAQGELEKRQAAILFADVVGYSRLMGENEAATLHSLQEHRFAVIDPTIGQHHGRIVKLLGDGIMVEFQNVVDAVNCAAAIQRGIISRNANVSEEKQVKFRMGINLGDVIADGEDIYGDGVNIASRLQELAEPNGICITSFVFGHIDGEVEHEFTDMGAHQLKNIAKAIRVFHFSPDATATPAKAAFRPFIDMPEEKEEPLVTGGCMCGNVRYEITDKPLGSMLCHCRMCQRFSGAPILGGTTLLTEALRFTKGQPQYYQSSNIAERGFCENCGGPLTYRGLIGRWTQWIMVWTASLDEPEKFPPTYHMGIESTMPWLNIHDDLPRTMSKDSPSLIDAYAAVDEEVP